MSELFSHAAAPSTAFDELVDTVATLLGEGGCAWDREQSHESLTKYLIEETYELVDAIETGTRDDVKEELGDVLYQLLFHAQLAARDGEGYDIQEVAAAANTKMRTRHPHVFGDVKDNSVAAIEANWQRLKAAEKADRSSVLDGVPQSLPALALASKVLGRAGRLGLIGDGTGGVSVGSERELGQLLLAITASASAAGLDAEGALRATVRELQAEVRLAEAAVSDAGVIALGESGADSASDDAADPAAG